MSPKIFLTGSTGYLGGTTLNLLLGSFPTAQIFALVRTKEQAVALPSCVTPLIGDISSEEVVTAAAKAADIVIDVAGDNEAGIKHILAGLASKEGPDKGTLIHVSGVTCLIDPLDLKLGCPAERIYSDAADQAELLSLPLTREHIALDYSILRAHADLGIKTVILSSCQIMGNGSGPWKKTTYGHWYVQAVLARGKAFQIDQGANLWSWVSVSDVAAAILFTLEEVLAGSPDLEYGMNGYYFVQTGESSFAEQAQVVAKKLKALGKLETDEVDELTVAQATEIHPYAGLLWGASCRSRADRLRAIGWVPRETEWKKLMEETVVTAIGV